MEWRELLHLLHNVIVAIVLYVFWKVVHKTWIIPSKEVDLVWQAPVIDLYEQSFTDAPVRFWTEMLQLVGLRKGKVVAAAP
jgi:amino acid transporter